MDYKLIVIGLVVVFVLISSFYFYVELDKLKKTIIPVQSALVKLQQPLLPRKFFGGESYDYTATAGKTEEEPRQEPAQKEAPHIMSEIKQVPSKVSSAEEYNNEEEAETESNANELKKISMVGLKKKANEMNIIYPKSIKKPDLIKKIIGSKNKI